MNAQPEAGFWIEPVSQTASVARMDAEHFQPAYKELEASLRRTGEAVRLDQLVSYCKRGLQPVYIPDGEVLVVNSQHVGERFINVDGAERTSLEQYKERPKAAVEKYDVLMNSTGLGTIGRVNCVLHDEPTVVDNHVTIIKVKPGAIDPLYLSVFLNSDLGRQQTYKWQKGSSGQLEIYEDDIRRFWVLVPDESVQEGIADQLRTAFELTRRANATARDAALAVLNMVDRP
ncbi:restriction endonuclease subunit S [Micromonospora profundi]|uniref:restriction endonuclease subunit S n=1 Tax=Micromonospora profundi TaxID=1420889 RepID=UPI0036869D37